MFACVQSGGVWPHAPHSHLSLCILPASDNDEDPVITQAEALDQLVRRDFGFVTVNAHVHAFEVVSLTRCSVLSRCYE